MADHVGQQLGNYRVIRLIGRGGFADVYLGEHIYLNTPVALKMLQTRVAGDDLEGFLREARTLARLVHPHIVRVLDFGVVDEIPFLVLDYAPSGTLRQRHPRGSTVPLINAVSYTRQVADALQYAHDEKYVHRDIKPENMLLGRRDEILLGDFGIALIAQSSRYQPAADVAGTVGYMAPEQIQGKPRPASDQYALAAVIYEWLSGDRLFRGSFSEVCAQHMFSSPPSLREKVPSISSPVEQVILTALAKDPAQRFKSVRAFANALEQASRQDWSDGIITGSDIALPHAPLEQQAVSLSSSPPQQALPSSPPSSEEPSSPSPMSNPAQASSSSPILFTAPTSEDNPAPAKTEKVSPVEAEESVMEAHGTSTARHLKKIWQIWGIGSNQVMAAVCGVLLYGLLNYPINSLYQQSSSLVTSSLSVFNQSIPIGIVLAEITLIIPLFLGAVFGPWVGLVTIIGGAFLGASFAGYNAALDYYGASWTWNVGHPLIGFIAGLVFLKTQGRYRTATANAMAVFTGAVGIIIGTAFSTYGDIWVSGVTAVDAWSNFLILALPCIISLVALPFLLFAYNRIVERRRRHKDQRI